MKACGLACLVLAGCAGPSDPPRIPSPGSGLVEYRDVTRQASRAVAATLDSLHAVAQDPARGVADFDPALRQLELTSIKARARAEAIIARGQEYFNEWHEQLAAVTNQPSARGDYNRLYDHFTLIRQRSNEVGKEFRPFMASLRQFRARLDHPAASDEQRNSSDDVDTLTTSGRRVLKTLESVSVALNDAETELHAMLNAQR
jgi:hypothetical protein